MHSTYASINPYITKDGSEIRELMHPAVQGNRSQSLAEARVPVAGKTLRHRHLVTEELYHITQGIGLMSLNDDTFEVCTGDTICIPPGAEHCIENIGNTELVILCACSPAYSHDDTVLSER